MTPQISEVLARISRRQQAPLFLVGGPVRDSLLARPCHDWDFVCRRAQSLARRAAKALHAKFITLDDQNRIYRVILPDRITLDFAELRGKTIEQDLSRRDFTINAMAVPITLFSPFKKGGLRGICSDEIPPSLPLSKGGVTAIIDPFNGRRDLKGHIIRAVSTKAFEEDPLRLLRAFRFAAQFGFRIESKTLGWIKQKCAPLTLRPLPSERGEGGVRGVAAERIREEFLKLLKQPHSAPVLAIMDKAGLLTALFPDLETCRRTAVRYYGKDGVLKHSLETVENLEWIFERIEGGIHPPYKSLPASLFQREELIRYLREPIGGFPRQAWLKFAGLLHDIGKPATAEMIKSRLRFFGHEDVGARMARRILRDLRCSRQEVQGVAAWVQNHMRPGNLAAAQRITDKAVARFFRDLGDEGVGMLLVSLGDHYGYLARNRWGRGTDPVEKITRRMLDSYYLRRESVLPSRIVNGHVLMKKLRLKSGPLIGRLLEKIQDAQAEGKVTTQATALRYARKILRRHPGKS